MFLAGDQPMLPRPALHSPDHSDSNGVVQGLFGLLQRPALH